MKRKRNAHPGGGPPKKARRPADQSAVATMAFVEHPVLARLYPDVLSLRHYLLSRLPASSKSRRRKLSQLGHQHLRDEGTAPRADDLELGELLDTTLVGALPTIAAEKREEAAKERDRDIESFSQQLPLTTSASTFKAGYFLQSEVSRSHSCCTVFSGCSSI